MSKREASTIGRNTVSGRQLQDFVERIERVREAKKQLNEDEKLIFAELKAAGFTPARVRDVIKRRAAKPADVEEAEAQLDMYLHALGMATETPLFRSVGQMSVDLAARDEVIAAFKLLVPTEGEIIVKVGAQAVRLYRDKNGEAQAEDVVERPKPASKAASQMPERPKRDVPDVDAAGAKDLGRVAYRENQPITSNPFPWDDKRRSEFDAGWREASGTDGMGPSE
ncbi:MAG: DUF2312 domain-containing protein [Mesorhizobium sp.]|uniref:DUF2312 domain-containing protein n=1 Tax=unclassified Mesorhizobium TaxID=325217 RepID=UPI000FCC5CE9|nr:MULTISPECIES: DUF2312 domain-containing protein [unclassified Mesorhizobium]RUV69658.1 DUF2312 domain-containing protein [Mesorhizobium sp. M5C.F.Cr.IN.023.01.1.1]RWI51078.1 MAG: DUF2312 domain-containing protein [Mesorhizobium sp.]RWI62066.1 MAG: DUF2312 domain-containing protein [Mesorhizobium sp.]RWJ13916.1 MAG: DUF2312 domain-containing protein [Mesorhizobium sp.]RWJ16858.1 MAG: DUF2312 domain-containing protein [Mesorhizobium sp.]